MFKKEYLEIDKLLYIESKQTLSVGDFVVVQRREGIIACKLLEIRTSPYGIKEVRRITDQYMEVDVISLNTQTHEIINFTWDLVNFPAPSFAFSKSEFFDFLVEDLSSGGSFYVDGYQLFPYVNLDWIPV